MIIDLVRIVTIFVINLPTVESLRSLLLPFGQAVMQSCLPAYLVQSWKHRKADP